MTQTFTAHFDGKVIVPDEPVQLPVGQPLRVQLELATSAAKASPPFADLLKFAADLPDAPSDLAAQHDHYLYGSPKQ
jgi:hypothetical protein